ncbi:CPBP family intramembrane metalloprotease [candidate division KSB1 bacterium]|nr:CPBP family intramembrane metalloprotease [candidate division KSB1 bacterium]NIS23887.1 CPBP family intramembrane metalloprotease [candidate division KSB1 bacterium]NIT70804.1 CPBP family intramembrane metalloprotease [candidate division KSB1 bacterium]NIU24536.1 CPBP family intramembrane metalloprotease [candidate division KSB1 bacterium]NIU94490.1 CPBP family intramembrane metalloprotease [candidate division KSB1 bacterium]
MGSTLQSNRIAQSLEILVVFFLAFIIIKIAQPFVGDNPILRQSIVWVANVAMLTMVWAGLRLRGQSWAYFGLNLESVNLRTFLLSLLVFVAAVFGFVIGAIIMANIAGVPENANMSGYNYLQGNLPMLLGVLVAVFFVSSFGEEVIYRGFLITRISEMGGNGKMWLKITVLISAIIFGLVHFEWGVAGMVQTGFMGLALGTSYLLVKRNLWVLVLAHAYMDATLMIQMYLGGL